MISLQHKLALGFGGLLVVLLVVSILSLVVLERYSHSLERVFSENYNSAVYCNAMKESLDQLNARAQRLMWENAATTRVNVPAQEQAFEKNLQLQFGNITLKGEIERTRKLAQDWSEFKPRYEQFDRDSAGRTALYRDDLLPRFDQMKQEAQQIADMNMNNMVSVDGQVKHTLWDVRRALLVLVIGGTGLAGVVIWTSGAAILHPLRALTKSARQIEAGNLDLNLPVRSRDEIGQLSDAFNSMAARLREFRLRDRDRLSRTEQTTQLAIDSLPDAVFVIGPEGRVEIANRTARMHFGVEPGSTVEKLRLRWLTPLYESVRLGHKPVDPQGYEAAIQLFENGAERFLLPRAVPMATPDGTLAGVTVILVDVTPLRSADEAKSSVIATVSHELRTPLTGVRMSLSLLATDNFGPVTTKQQRLLTAAREDSDRLFRIIENLLNISRLEAGRAQLQFRWMEPKEIVKIAVDPLRAAFIDKKIRLEVEIQEGLRQVRVDPVSISSALTNLMSNALKFTPTGGEVHVSSSADGESVRFAVADTGPGIPIDFRHRVFEKFFRVPREAGPTGAGLGLTIAKDIVEAHGGTIEFDCPEEGGTVFSFQIPTADAQLTRQPV